MKTIVYTTVQALLISIPFSTAAYLETQAEAARQQIQQTVASSNAHSVISTMPILQEMWPNAMSEYFQSAEDVARFLGDPGADPAVQLAVEKLYTEILDKRCPEDAGIGQAAAYFKGKEKIVIYYFGFDNMRNNKPYLLAASRFLGEIRGWRIPNYEYKRIWHEEAVLKEAGVNYAFQLTDPKDIEAYEEAMRQNDRDIDIERFQYLLFSADSSTSFMLLGACKQMRHDGKLDEGFANEVAENARLTQKEREMRYEFDKEK